tara:strand:+ start:267 stop:368 length:102 start_codon:yes stop_codon:yes gene_type:complete
MKYLWRPPFRNNEERDEAIEELQELLKRIVEGG